MLRASLAVFALIAIALAACGGPCELEDQKEFWNEVASAGEGSFSCVASSQPYGCKVGDKGCVPLLVALFEDGIEQSAVLTKARKALAKAGYAKTDGGKAFKDGSVSEHYKKGDDEIRFSVGKLGKAVELTFIKKPDSAK